MAKVSILYAVVLLIAIKAIQTESCTYDSDCTMYGYGQQCCEDGLCYSEYQTCPAAQVLSGGIIAAIAIGSIVFIAIIITLTACRYCQTRSLGHIIVSQPAYQQFSVTARTTQMNPFSPGPPPPVPAPQVQDNPPPYMQSPPPQMNPV